MILPPRPYLIFWIGLLVVSGGIVFTIAILFQADIPVRAPLQPVATSIATSTDNAWSKSVVGYSKDGRPIENYSFRSGMANKRVLFVGGIHGGYEWNTVLLAYEAIDYFTTHPEAVPVGLSVEIIPVLNPDGLALVGVEGRFTAEQVAPNYNTGLGRFNANDVDLNRNFDCKWQPESTWRGQLVSAGSSAFSESEARILRDTVLSESLPIAVVMWHSRGNTVYASECENGVLPLTSTLMQSYATAAKYQTAQTFDAYAITGDAEGWLASLRIPAITVELETRESSEWERNLAGMTALLSDVLAAQ